MKRSDRGLDVPAISALLVLATRHNLVMRRRRWLVPDAAVVVLAAVVAVVALRARATHNHEVADLRSRTMRDLARVGIQGTVVSAGVDNGGAGSADCGVHVVVSISAGAPAQQVARMLSAVGPVYQDRDAGILVVAQEPAATGADAVLDLRCRDAIPFGDATPVR